MVVEEYVSTDAKGHAIGVHLGFDIISDRAILQSWLCYRVQGGTEYKCLTLRREPNLRYTALVRETQTVECYLSLKPEFGQGATIWSPDNPLLIPTADLERKREPKSGMTAGARSKFRTLGIIGVIIAAIIGIGVWKAAKH
ncbi:MAG: hypothetical protein LAN18_01995 [Acidobacteriia bacterium]|nr:hypothetical protein [Terriglobia bacterium]